MPNFTYKAVSSQRQITTGTIAAQNRDEVASMLTKQGLAPMVIKETTDKVVVHGTLPLIEKITFCRYLGVMLSTGLSLNEGIDVLARESKHPLMRKILTDMNYSLEQGQQLSTIFERYPDIFEKYFLTLVRAGEVSGKLAEIFRYLEGELRAQYSLNAKVKGALLYPAVVFVAMIGIGFLMFFFVLPQIGKVFLNLHLPLSPITVFLFTTSLTLSKHMIPILISMVVLGILGFFALRLKAVKRGIMVLVRPIPLIRHLIQKIDLARFNRIFSTLIRAAVPITEALEISLESLNWYQYRNLATVLPDGIKKGKSLSQLVKEYHVFPSLMVQMISAGEKTATLDSTLADLASFYEEEVEEEVKSLTQIIEPVMMLLVGIGVGAMILMIIAPIYSVVGNFQQAASGRR